MSQIDSLSTTKVAQLEVTGTTRLQGVVNIESPFVEATVIVGQTANTSGNKRLSYGLTSTFAHISGSIYQVGGLPLVLQNYGGNVLVNTQTDAGYKLDVAGTGRFTGILSLGTGSIGGITIDATPAGAKIIQSYGSQPLAINPSGNNFLIGTTTDSSYKLDVAGTVRASGALTLTNLAGSGAQMLVIDNAGVVNKQAIPSGYTVSSKTAAYTETIITGTTLIQGDTTTAGFTITLPSAIGNTSTIIIKKTAGANNLTVGTSLSQTIDGATTAVLIRVYESITLMSNNANWLIV